MRPKMRCRTVYLLVVMVGLLAARQLRAESNNCENPPKESHYTPLPGDTEDATHFAASRTLSGAGRMEVNVCAGELRMRRSKDGQLHLSVETGKTPELKMRAYIRTLDVTADHATISLQYPKGLHPVVVLALPAGAELRSEINLGAGKLAFYADEIGGDREINVGYGDATLYLAGDRDYAHLDANVGMGSFHDHRPGGGSGHFAVSRNLEGRGSGRLEMNVGMGSLNLEPAQN